jgi:hypothetical protein
MATPLDDRHSIMMNQYVFAYPKSQYKSIRSHQSVQPKVKEDMVTLKPGEAIKRSWDINEIFEFETPQDYTLDAGFYLIWFQEEETVFKLENGF